MQVTIKLKVDLDLKKLGVDGVSDLDNVLGALIDGCVQMLEVDKSIKIVEGLSTREDGRYIKYYPNDLDRSEACDLCDNLAVLGYDDSGGGQVCKDHADTRHTFYPI